MPGATIAVDAGVSVAGAAIDWDGETRPWGARPDLGADEFVAGGSGGGGGTSQTLFSSQVPAAEYTAGVNYELGMRVFSDVAGQITALR